MKTVPGYVRRYFVSDCDSPLFAPPLPPVSTLKEARAIAKRLRWADIRRSHRTGGVVNIETWKDGKVLPTG